LIAACLGSAALALGGGFLLGRATERHSELGRILELEARTREVWELVGIADSVRLELLRRGVPPARLYPVSNRAAADSR